MGKKRTAKAVEEKPEIWCFYCDREFEDERILIQHQKAKHFKCDWCTKKMQNAGGLVVHALQVHKETVKKIPNAKEDRDLVEFDIQGMNGIPDEFLSESAKARKRQELGAYEMSAVPMPMFAPPAYAVPYPGTQYPYPPPPFPGPMPPYGGGLPPPPPPHGAPMPSSFPPSAPPMGFPPGAPPMPYPMPQFQQPPPMPPPQMVPPQQHYRPPQPSVITSQLPGKIFVH